MSTSSICIFKISQRNFDLAGALWYNKWDIYHICIMWIWIIFLLCTPVLLAGYIFLLYSERSIERSERDIIRIFTARSDILCQLFEVSQDFMSRHEEIFREVFSLRKKEFSLIGVTHSLESFLQIEEAIHHEINFIFQVCNKNPKLNTEKKFLYVRDLMVEKSSSIGKEMKLYRKKVLAYNNIIRIKNISILWLFLPFHKKALI